MASEPFEAPIAPAMTALPDTKAAIWLDRLNLAGLLLFLLLLPFHLVIKKLVPDPLGTYWKEGLLVLLLGIWGVRSIQSRRLTLTGTPLDLAVGVYVGLLLVRAVLDHAGMTTAWGLYVSILYLPLVWLVPAALRGYPGWFRRLGWLLVAVGGVVALGGLVEFVLNKALWPSIEMIERQGFADVYVYNTHLRRVYFVFDSPTTLANTLAMLLPISLALMVVSTRLWQRILAGLLAVMMAACILVTFSRGIWVAAIIALLFMGFTIGFVQRRRRVVAIGAGVLIMAVFGFGAVMAPRFIQPALAEQRIVELFTPLYRQTPLSNVTLNLDQVQPVEGALELQQWLIHDPVAGVDDTRTVIYQHPLEKGKGEILYQLQVPPQGALRFAIALSPQVWDPEKGDGATFNLFVTPVDHPEQSQLIFDRYINPRQNPGDRRWRNYLVDLSPWAGQTVNLGLETLSGPVGNWSFDWTGWADMQVGSVSPQVFTENRPGTGNLLFNHLRSILDWQQDETNRDRLIAWNQALDAWKQSPLWGTGLGTTGVAVLRVNPEAGFVTESQVLKSLTELGIPGLLALAFLWFAIARLGWRAFRASGNSSHRIMLLGMLASLLVVFIESFVYQNLEVKQVNAYFWTFVGMVAFRYTDSR